MIITDLVEITKNKYRVYIDEEIAFVLYKGDLRKFDLKKDGIISKELFDRIINEVVLKRAKKRAMDLLVKKDYTRFQLSNKLKENNYPDPVIEQTLEYLDEFHYIDDEKYTKSYYEYYIYIRGKNRIKQDLIKKGIDRFLIDKIFEENVIENEHEIELGKIVKIFQKKLKGQKTVTYEEKMKLMNSLFRMGFSATMIEEGFNLYMAE